MSHNGPHAHFIIGLDCGNRGIGRNVFQLTNRLTCGVGRDSSVMQRPSKVCSERDN